MQLSTNGVKGLTILHNRTRLRISREQGTIVNYPPLFSQLNNRDNSEANLVAMDCFKEVLIVVLVRLAFSCEGQVSLGNEILLRTDISMIFTVFCLRLRLNLFFFSFDFVQAAYINARNSGKKHR